MPFSGAVTRKLTAGRDVAGSLSSSGSLSRITRAIVSVGGVLSGWTGTIGLYAAAIKLSVGGVLSFSGALARDVVGEGVSLFSGALFAGKLFFTRLFNDD